ncbi:MAG TPA: hypothetical protein VHN79_09955, partial [Lacunisphaera sp.]|nr:hypothetical protein [Lacunisphaera sp.]
GVGRRWLEGAEKREGENDYEKEKNENEEARGFAQLFPVILSEAKDPVLLPRADMLMDSSLRSE